MTRSRLRAAVPILLLLIICGVAGYDLKSSFGARAPSHRVMKRRPPYKIHDHK